MLDMDIKSVSDITREIKANIEALFPSIAVEGEISNFVHHSSGHMYFSLKDSKASLSCTFFKNYNFNLNFRPKNGDKVIVLGGVTVYPPRGTYQLKIVKMFPMGVGLLQEKFEKLKKQLSQEGLFDDSKKKKLPSFPRTIGIVTSPTGAAVKDILNVINRRNTLPEILIYPAHVQGDRAGSEIISGIKYFNEHKTDLIILTRGGGSIEDLWPFNEESVGRAVHESEIPIITGIGHEIDFTIADFAADYRAPTPSAAAEIAVRDIEEITQSLDYFQTELIDLVQDKILYYDQKLDHILELVKSRNILKKIVQTEKDIQYFTEKIFDYVSKIIIEKENRVRYSSIQLQHLNPISILDKGYCILRDSEDKIVKSIKNINADDIINVEMKNGKIHSKVLQVIDSDDEILES